MNRYNKIKTIERKASHLSQFYVHDKTNFLQHLCVNNHVSLLSPLSLSPLFSKLFL